MPLVSGTTAQEMTQEIGHSGSTRTIWNELGNIKEIKRMRSTQLNPFSEAEIDISTMVEQGSLDLKKRERDSILRGQLRRSTKLTKYAILNRFLSEL